MSRHSKRPRLAVLASAALIAGCGAGEPQQTERASTTSSAVAAAADANAPPTSSTASGASSPDRQRTARSGELGNPDASTMVFLYYDLAGIAAPIDQWAEADNRLRFAAPADKAALRVAIRAEIEAGTAAVRDIGFIRLALNADLSDYDPAYGEFTVRALAPSSVVSFDAFDQKVSLKFGNGRHAQVWSVTETEAAAVRDKLGFGRSVSLDALLKITGVQPAPQGGTIVADVLEYEMREALRGTLIGRVQVSR